jgi:tetratricopeptide (TPR) repeat protein
MNSQDKKVSRNDPCPCGSGRKYKKCCLPRQEAARPRCLEDQTDQPFIAELRPDVDERVNRLLQRLERGDRQLEGEITALLKEYPRYHTTNYAMGVYLAVAKKDVRGAMRFFEKAIEILPPFPEAHFNLGNAARQACQIPKAVTAYHAAERYSQEGDGIAELARKELQWLETVLLKTTPFRSLDAYLANAKLFDAAFELLKAGEFERSARLFQQVLRENPEHVQSYGNLGLAYAGLGQRSNALASLDRALELDPGYEPARLNRRIIAQMREGESSVPYAIRETEFYRERLERESKLRPKL